MKNQNTIQSNLHHIMSCVGGFLGAYAILNRCDLFGNAQTSNLIYIAMHLLGGNFKDVLLRVIGMIIYMAGIASTVVWKKKFSTNIHIYSVTVDACALILLGFIPTDANAVVALYPIFFAAAVQWNSFPSVFGYNSSTIFSTNNLRQFTMASTEYIINKSSKHSHKAIFYGLGILCYHVGVTVAYLSYIQLGVKSAWVGIGIVVVAAGAITYEHKTENVVIAEQKAA